METEAARVLSPLGKRLVPQGIRIVLDGFRHFEVIMKEQKPIKVELVKLGPLASKAMFRPKDFFELSPQTQWSIDKSLGILDWSGDPKE